MSVNFKSKFYNSYGRKRSTVEIATVSAQNVHKSQYGEAIVEKNPLEDKQLQNKLKKLDKKKRAIEEEYFWSQRQFFIQKAFNENNELKYTKLNANSMRDKELTLPAINSAKSLQGDRDRYTREARRQRPLTKSIFPVDPNLNLPAISSNYKLLIETQQKHRLSLDKAQTVLNLMITQEDGTTDREKKQNGGSFGKPFRLPVIGKENKSAAPLNKKRNKTKQNTDKKKSEKSNQPNSAKELKSSTQFIDIDDIADDNDIKEFERKFQKLGIGSSQNKSNEDVDFIKSKNNFIDVLRNFSRSLEDLSTANKTKIENNFQTRSLILDNSESRTSKSDELLIKLTKSLPMHLLIKTDETLNDLTTVLGYAERNKALAAMEKAIANQPCVVDERFKNLVSALDSKEPKTMF